MCIGYAFRPHLSSRLTWSGRTFLQKPESFGHYDSHIILATYSGILTCVKSTPAYANASPLTQRSPTTHVCRTPSASSACLRPLPLRAVFNKHESQASVYCLAPLNFRRRTTRPVSYYALFECVAASEPTSWLSVRSHILFHLTVLRDLSCGSGLFPF